MAAESNRPPLPAVPSAPAAGAAGSDTTAAAPLGPPGPLSAPRPAWRNRLRLHRRRPRDLPASRRRLARALCPALAAAPAPRPSLCPRPARRPRGHRRAPPALPVLARAADLEQELDPLDGRHRSLADGGGDAARQKVLEEGDGLVRHVRAAPELPGGRLCCRLSRKGGSAAAHGLNAGQSRPRPRLPIGQSAPKAGVEAKTPRPSQSAPLRRQCRSAASPGAARSRHRPGPAPAGQPAGSPLLTLLSPLQSPSQALSALAFCPHQPAQPGVPRTARHAGSADRSGRAGCMGKPVQRCRQTGWKTAPRERDRGCW